MSRIPPDEIGDPRDYERALGIFLGQAEQGLRGLTRRDENGPDPTRLSLWKRCSRGRHPAVFPGRKGSAMRSSTLVGKWQ